MSTPTDTTQTSTTPADPPATTSAPTTPTAGDQAGNPEARFTQADVSRIAANARGEGRSAERAALLQELGVQDVGAVKSALAQAEELKRAQLTESERLKADAADARKAAADAEAARQAAEQARQSALVEAEIIAQAAGRFANPKAVSKLIDRTAVKLDEKGQVVGVAEALETLAKAEPWTLAQAADTNTKAKAPAIGATNGKPGAGGTAQEVLASKYFGRGRGSGFFEPKSDGVRT